MIFEMTISVGAILNFIAMMLTLIAIAVKITRFTVAFERRIDKLEMTITNQWEYVQKFENATKADVARLEAMNDACYVKERIKDLDAITKNQVELRAQLPLKLEAISKEIADLSDQVKGMRADMAARRSTDR